MTLTPSRTQAGRSGLWLPVALGSVVGDAEHLAVVEVACFRGSTRRPHGRRPSRSAGRCASCWCSSPIRAQRAVGAAHVPWPSASAARMRQPWSCRRTHETLSSSVVRLAAQHVFVDALVVCARPGRLGGFSTSASMADRVVGRRVVGLVQPTQSSPRISLSGGRMKTLSNPVNDGGEVVLQAGDLGVTAMLRQVGVDTDALGRTRPTPGLPSRISCRLGSPVM